MQSNHAQAPSTIGGAPVQATLHPISRRRSERAHQAILDAADALLREVGYSALRIEQVAARAGVGKATVYRWWASKPDLIIETLTARLAMGSTPETGSTREDLLAIARSAMLSLSATSCGVIPGLAADLCSDPERAEVFRCQIVRPRRRAVILALERGMEHGELPADVDVELIGDVLDGTIFNRVLIRGEPIEDHLAEQLVDLVLGVQAPPWQAVRSERSSPAQ